MRFSLTSHRTTAQFTSPEVKTASVVRTLTIIIVGAVLAGGIVLALFFYKHVYFAISFSEEILLLKSEFTFDAIDLGTFEEIHKWWEERNGRGTPPHISRDPFVF